MVLSVRIIFGVVRMTVNTLKREVTIMKLLNAILFRPKKYITAFYLSSDVNNASIDTCYIKETKKYETGISHPSFNEWYWVIVEEYDDEITAKTGHEKWVKTFEKWLPKELKDVINNAIYKRELFE
jgi:hypothetical protein